MVVAVQASNQGRLLVGIGLDLAAREARPRQCSGKGQNELARSVQCKLRKEGWAFALRSPHGPDESMQLDGKALLTRLRHYGTDARDWARQQQQQITAKTTQAPRRLKSTTPPPRHSRNSYSITNTTERRAGKGVAQIVRLNRTHKHSRKKRLKNLIQESKTSICSIPSVHQYKRSTSHFIQIKGSCWHL